MMKQIEVNYADEVLSVIDELLYAGATQFQVSRNPTTGIWSVFYPPTVDISAETGHAAAEAEES